MSFWELKFGITHRLGSKALHDLSLLKIASACAKFGVNGAGATVSAISQPTIVSYIRRP